MLAHPGHDHSRPETKSTQIETEKTQSNITPETQPSPAEETKTVNVTLQQTKESNLIPQASEIIFLLLVANPIILKLIKQKLL